MLALVSMAELLGMSLWFAASAVSAQYQVQWQLSASEAAWLTTVVQLGFVGGTALSALLNLADVWPTKRLFTACALLAASANAMVLTANDLPTALMWRWSLSQRAPAGARPGKCNLGTAAGPFSTVPR